MVPSPEQWGQSLAGFLFHSRPSSLLTSGEIPHPSRLTPWLGHGVSTFSPATVSSHWDVDKNKGKYLLNLCLTVWLIEKFLLPSVAGDGSYSSQFLSSVSTGAPTSSSLRLFLWASLGSFASGGWGVHILCLPKRTQATLHNGSNRELAVRGFERCWWHN